MSKPRNPRPKMTEVPARASRLDDVEVAAPARSGLAERHFGARPVQTAAPPPKSGNRQAADADRPHTPPAPHGGSLSRGEMQTLMSARDAFHKKAKAGQNASAEEALASVSKDSAAARTGLLPGARPAPEVPALAVSAAAMQAASAPEGYRRLGLPSQFVPYDFDALYIRPLKVGDLALMAAAQETGDISALYDAVAACVQGVDVRDLTAPDFRSLLYWLRLNSYPRSPYTVKWTSYYGNANELRMLPSDLQINKLEMTKAEYAAYKEQGIRFPTLRDTERMKALAVDPGSRYLFELAQYLHIDGPNDSGDWMQTRIQKLSEMPTDIIAVIKEFSQKVESYGVSESVKVRDAKFDATAAVAYLREMAQTMLDVTDSLRVNASSQFLLEQAEAAQQMFAEAERIESHLADPENVKYEPKEETIMLTINVMAFFP